MRILKARMSERARARTRAKINLLQEFDSYLSFQGVRNTRAETSMCKYKICLGSILAVS